MKSKTHKYHLLLISIIILITSVSCAKMAQPDGGWFDETPPKVLSCSPANKAVNVRNNKIVIEFDEYIKLDNPTEKVIISPPQIEPPIIKAQGKRIVVELKDTLKANTTYTIDFSDAISDNNEGNPMGNYTYSFSTGSDIDTLEVSGFVLNAQDFEPIKGILVGLHYADSDTAFTTLPFLRVGRSNEDGKFIIKGIAPGKYKTYALQDMDGNYFYSQKSEMFAFNNTIVEPYSQQDERTDTIWRDSLHIENLTISPYTHFYPDNISLLAFTETNSNRYLIKAERPQPECIKLYFSYGNEHLPEIKLLNINSSKAFSIEINEKQDTITYWINDSAIINNDTLNTTITYFANDTLGLLKEQTDTIDFISKISYERRLKNKEKAFQEWKKKQDKAKKAGRKYELEMKQPPINLSIENYNKIVPTKKIRISSPYPFAFCDTTKVHLYAKKDTIWYKQPLSLKPQKGNIKAYEVETEWKLNTEYSFELDSAAFKDIYNNVSKAEKQGFKTLKNEDYCSITLTLSNTENSPYQVMLLSSNGDIVQQTTLANGKAVFNYVSPGVYYAMAYADINNNKQWDTGEYNTQKQAEKVSFYNSKIETKANWDLNLNWNINSLPPQNQKPQEIIKQKGAQKQKIQQRNKERAVRMGIPYNKIKQ